MNISFVAWILLILSANSVLLTFGIQYFMTDGYGAVPFDKCVIIGDGPAIFSCNSNGTIVTQTVYDYSIPNVNCDGTIASTTTYTTSEADFSCFGHISYTTLEIRTDFFSTCDLSIASSSFVTDLCVDIDGTYVKLS